MNPLRVRIGVLGLALMAGLSTPTATAAAADPAPAPTVEEQRLDQAVPQEILRRSGFDSAASGFARDLARVHSYAQARRVVVRDAAALWRRAVDRAQGRGPAGEGISRDDDRPLYWARLGMTREVRTWEPEFGDTTGFADRRVGADIARPE